MAGGSPLALTTFWQLAYHLSGITLLGQTEQELLGPLPVPVRSAVLFTAQELDRDALTLTVGNEQLHFSDKTYRWVKSWSIKEAALARMLTSRKRVERETYSSADAYFKAHKLFEKRDGQDIHFAERLFVQQAFVPVFGLVGLLYLHPQVPFESTSGRRCYIDFG